MLKRDYYLYPPGYQQVANEQNEHYVLDFKEGEKQGWLTQTPTEDGKETVITLIANNGLFIPIRGAMFPLKCYAEAGAVFATNQVKAILIETVKLIGKWYMLPFLVFLNKQAVLDAFNRIAMKSLSPYLLVDNCLTDFSKTLKVFLIEFMEGIGFTSDSSQTFAVLMANLMDYDNAYRLRFEDTFSETSKELLQNPRKEFSRLLGVMKAREVRPGSKGKAIHFKFKVFVFLLRFIMLNPKIKKAFIKAINLVDIEKLKLDEIDTYWVCMRNDYLWLGMTDTQRKSYAQSKGWQYPRPVV